MPSPMNSKRVLIMAWAMAFVCSVAVLFLATQLKADTTLPITIDSATTTTTSTSDSLAIAGQTNQGDNHRSLAERTGAIASTPVSELPTSTGSITAIVRMIGALCAVLALMWVAVVLAKRFLRGRSGLANGSKQMSVVETLWLGPKKQIVLLSVGSRQVVIGVTEGTMTTLSELTIDELPQPGLAPEKSAVQNPPLPQKTNRPFEGLLEQAGGRLQQLLKQTNVIS